MLGRHGSQIAPSVTPRAAQRHPVSLPSLSERHRLIVLVFGFSARRSSLSFLCAALPPVTCVARAGKSEARGVENEDYLNRSRFVFGLRHGLAIVQARVLEWPMPRHFKPKAVNVGHVEHLLVHVAVEVHPRFVAAFRAMRESAP